VFTETVNCSHLLVASGQCSPKKPKMPRCIFLAPFLKRHCTNRMDRLRREDDGKGRQVKKAQDAEQSLLSKVHLNFQTLEWML
jgi:hypothetical protein